MNPALDWKLLFVLIVANGAPVIAKAILGRRYSIPLDGGRNFPDGQRFLGDAKTVRGILVSIAAAAAAARIVGLAWIIGALIAAAAMLGDVISSFTKRRLGMPASSMAIGLDQVPESLLPLLASLFVLRLTVADIAAIVASFVIVELLLSRLLHRLRLRDRPY
ncbi:MAG: CDP-archaeol synthase [Rhizomicrobium sp.]